MRFEKFARVARGAPVLALLTDTAIVSKAVLGVVSAVAMRYQNCSVAWVASAGIVTSWYNVSVPLT